MAAGGGERAPRKAARRRRRLLIGAGIAGGVLLVVLANAHLVYVAVTSQPACVAHEDAMDGTDAAYRAAKSAC